MIKTSNSIRLAFAIAAFGLLSAGPGSAQDASKPVTDRGVLSAAVTDFIQPGYRNFRDKAQAMGAAISPLCEAPSAPGLEVARKAFGELVTAWSEIEIIRFGPVVDDNRLERILFFPDRRGIGLKQIQQVLAEKDETATTPERLAAKSVALQGLTTLEYLLYGTGAEDLAGGDEFRCDFAGAVAARIYGTAGELVDAWDDPEGIAARLSDPKPENPDFRDEREGLQALLGVFVNSSELVADTRLKPFLGAGVDEAKPKSAIFWRSGLTGTAIAGDMKGLQELYKASGMIELTPEDIQRYGTSAMFELSNAQRTIDRMKQPLPQAAADPETRDAANYLRLVLLSIRDTFSGRIAGGLGLSAGFSSLDGD
ncbi:peptidase M75, Imelysin [Pseudohoeflea suaedae]|uniref:Peptidase M75, Imelysin n=1 Tax=Pseudohoeflea suaedae TaxID=877384 RepID=A0A4R5PK37_9HYPH|nr:imelysin family protein [Pseudohoeflea suaedae]TDH35955.1 peptidase M75, Imelysin [Pseudohoeflea suaedae]